MQRGHGKLIVFEGIDGSGKSTQMGHLLERLTKENVNAAMISYSDQAWFREAYVKQPSFSDLHHEVEFFAWAFNTLVNQCIIPLLHEGKVVLVDRYSLSYLAYQSFHGVDQERLASKLMRNAPNPELLIILEVSLETALKRCQERAQQAADSDRVPFALTSIARLKHAATYYKYHAPSNALIVNGELPMIEVSEQIWCAAKQLLYVS